MKKAVLPVAIVSVEVQVYQVQQLDHVHVSQWKGDHVAHVRIDHPVQVVPVVVRG